MMKWTLPLSPSEKIAVFRGFILSAALSAALPTLISPSWALAAPLLAPATAVSAFEKPLSPDKQAVHLLNRLAFGPRPGDVEILRQMGARNWIKWQLSPQKIDDSTLEAQLSGLTWLDAPADRLQLAYLSDNYNRRLRRQEKAQTEAMTTPNAEMAPNNEMAMPNGAMPNGAIETPVAARNRGPAFNARQQKQLARIEAAQMPPNSSIRALGELSTDKLARAIASKRQLQEVLVDFWGNHFNVDVKKNRVATFKIRDDRDVIRPHVLGSFRDMLGESAHSPAMLIYLDNVNSTLEMKARDGKTRGGLNENYARELMELHTVGVEGGYSQKDVTEVARCFTGWSVDPETGQFLFRARAHDNGPKTVLGRSIAAGGGQSDGEQVLDILASRPETAKFLARKLCQRFVGDAPPTGLVSRVAAAFSGSNGDLKTTYRALFESPEFASEGAYRAKIKSPFEFTVSAVRGLGGTLTIASEDGAAPRLLVIGAASYGRKENRGKGAAGRPLAALIAEMGQPLFSCQPPTGWSEDSSKWVSASALISRLNFALSLTSGRVYDVAFEQDTFRGTSLDTVAQSILGQDVSPSTRSTIEAEAQKAPGDGARLRALLLGSPEFQRR